MKSCVEKRSSSPIVISLPKLFTVTIIFLLGCLSARPQAHIGDSLGHMLVQQSPIDPWHASNADSCFELISFPNDYNANPTKKYPVIFFFHGMGEAGPANGSQLSLQLENALPQFISQGLKPSAVGADGNTYKFIVVCPQATGGSITIQQFWYILPDILKKIRADTTRMYITGLSYGGYGTWSCLTDDGASPYQGFINHFAAILPQSQVALDQSINTGTATNYNRVAHVKDAATDSLPVLIVCGDMDDKWQYSVAYKDSINAHQPYVPAILIDRPGLGHVAAAWDSIYSPTFRPPDISGKNGYEWLIQYTNKRGFKLAAGGSPPVVKVEGAQVITMPTSTVTLSGSGTPSAGHTISSHLWTKSSGGAATITSPSSDTTTVTGLVQGTYSFVLTVTDNAGEVATSSVAITVNAAAASPPVVKIEGSQAITLPTSTVTLSGSGTPSAGHTISSHIWTKSSGGAATITSPSSDTTTVTGLVQGTYSFVLTVTDNAGEVATSSVAITVNAASSSTGSTPPSTAAVKYSVANGEYANFILDNTTQTLYGVGNGAIGNGTNTGLDGVPIACQFPSANTKIKFVAAGLHGAACIDVSGNVYFTGPNEDGDMGNGTTTGSANSFVAIPTDSAGNPFTNVTYLRMTSSIFTGGQGYGAIVYAIKSDGTLWVWGNTQGGYRGDGTYGRVNTKPVQITTFPAGTVITKVIVENVAIALDANGNVWTWAGNNTAALLGNSSQANYETPQKITLPSSAIDIAGGGFFSYALLANHSLYGWGWYTGYMGVGCCSGSGVVGLNPPAIPMLLDSSLDLPSPIAHLSTNGTSTYVILSDGTLWAWGGNECGQIGNGQEIDYKRYTVNPAPYGGSTPSPYDWNQDASTAQLQQHKPMQIAPGISNFVALSEGSA
jgi:alpha-tubulin suppressor-like RCC1 family protein